MPAQMHLPTVLRQAEVRDDDQQLRDPRRRTPTAASATADGLRPAEADGLQGGGHLLRRRVQDAGRSSASRRASTIDLNAGYDIFDEAGQQLGFFSKDFGASLLRSTFHVEGPGYAGTGQERSQAVALVRRFTDIPFLPIHFDFVDPRGPAAAGRRAPGLGARQVHRARARPARRLPGRGGRRGRPRRADAALSRGAVPRGPARGRGRRRRDRRSRPGVRRRGGPRARPARPRRARAARGRRRGRATSTPTGSRAGSTSPTAPSRAWSLHLHGGGFVLNDVEVHDAAARRLANRSGLRVLSVDYRRPPEHRFPAAPDDVDTVLAWLERGRRRSTASTARAYAHGDSAGANLALVAALRHPGRFARRRAGLPLPRPDGRLRVATAPPPTASTPARPPGTGQQYAAAPPTSSTPTWPRCARTGSARCRRRWW